MNILYISGEDIPGDHGGSIHTWYVARGWVKLGHRVTVLCRKRKDQVAFEELEGVRIRRVKMELCGKGIPLMGLPALPRLMSDPWDTVVERYDVFGGLGAILARLKRIPLLLEVNYPHLEELIWKWRQRNSRFLNVPLLVTALRWWGRWQYRQAAGAIATRKDIVPDFLKDKTWLVHWGADPERFRPLDDDGRERVRRELGIEGRPAVLFMGSFRPWHGVEMLPDLIDLTRQAVPEVVFLMVGDGKGREKLQAELSKRSLDSWVVFTGNLQHNHMPELLSSADIGIAPYDAHQYQPLIDFGFFWSPAKLFEYSACGLPVVCSNYDLLSEIVEDGESGYLVPAGNVQAFSKAVIDLCQGPEKRAIMGKKGRQKIVEKFSWDLHAKRVAEILEHLAANHRVRGGR